MEIEYWKVLQEGNLEHLQQLLKNNSNLVHTTTNSNPWKYSPNENYHFQTSGVHFCSFAKREPLLRELLQHEPDLETLTFEDNKGITTPLALATWEGSIESCQLLLEAGANPNTWASAESPLYTAAEHHDWEKVALLEKFGAKHDIFTACICGKLEIVEMEIRAYKPLLERRSTKRNLTPLEESTEHSQKEVEKLINRLQQIPD